MKPVFLLFIVFACVTSAQTPDGISAPASRTLALTADEAAFAVTLALIAVNALVSFRALTHKRQVLVILNCVQIVLFGTLNYQTSNGWMNYNAGFLSLRKRTTHGLTAIFNYTWAHCLDSGLAQSDSLGGQRDSPYNPKYNYGPCITDIRQAAQVFGRYDLPSPKNASPLMRKLLGCWATSYVFTASTGLPLKITGATNAFGAGVGSVVAIGWGRAVREVIRAGLPRMPGVLTVAATGGMQQQAAHFQVNEFVRLAAEEFGGTPHFIHAHLPRLGLHALNTGIHLCYPILTGGTDQ